MGWGGVVCTVIFMSNPTIVLCCVGVVVGVLTIGYFKHGFGDAVIVVRGSNR